MDSVTKQSGYPKEVFFLGAGASVLAGVPTFADFHKKATKIINEILAENEPDDEYISHRNLKAMRNDRMLQSVLSHWVKNFNNYTIEEFYAAIEINEMLANNKLNKNKYEDITTEDISKFIYFIIKKSLTNTSGSENIYEIFLRLVRTSKAAIITTNWDIVLESSKQFPLEGGWVDYESVTAHDATSNKVNPLTEVSGFKHHILKLHGSLNWGFCDNCERIYYLNKEIYEDLTLFDDDVASYGVECNNEACRENHIKLKTVIVPPTLSKLAKAQPQLVSIWNKAKDYLKLCNKIYFIGYSFPETDMQMRIFISNALRENSNLNKVIIVSSQKHGASRVEFEERYLSVLSRVVSPSKIDFYYKGFDEFCMDSI
jgi:NAD-dependent SIR2 family protein deacetylase